MTDRNVLIETARTWAEAVAVAAQRYLDSRGIFEEADYGAIPPERWRPYRYEL